MKNRRLIGSVVATAVAGLFLAGHALAADQAAGMKEAKVKCMGANACKGKGACKGMDNSCAGKNGCKGKGWIEVKSEKECLDKGGKVAAAAKEAK